MVFRMLSVLLLMGGFLIPTVAFAAGSFEDALANLNSRKFKDKQQAITRIAESGDARALVTLEALLAGQLFTRKSDKKVLIGEKSHKVYRLTDPLTGQETGQAPLKEFKKIRINNKLRGLLRGAIGGLTLLSPDPGKRLAAADAVFKARSADMVPVLEKALQREEESQIQERLARALAAIQASHSQDPAQKVIAIDQLSHYSEPDVRALLGNIALNDESEIVRDAAQKALERVEQDLARWALLGNLFQGISLGSVLLLAAVGLAITFGVMGVINMAHGELVMLGAYTTFVVQDVIRSHAPELFAYSLFIAIPAAFIVAGSVGMLIERSVIRYLYGRPLETLLATWGLSLILQQFMRTLFGPTNQEVGTPDWMSGFVEITGGLVLTYNRIAIIVFSLFVVLLLALILRKTAFGLQMRAVTQNRPMAASMGIRTGVVDMMTFGLGAGIAGMAGVALSQIDNVSPNLGQTYIIDSFMVVVFGGVGNLWGTLVGAFSIGIVNKFLEPVSGAVLGKIIVLVAIILFIQKRPRGLFALKGRAVES